MNDRTKENLRKVREAKRDEQMINRWIHNRQLKKRETYKAAERFLKFAK